MVRASENKNAKEPEKKETKDDKPKVNPDDISVNPGSAPDAPPADLERVVRAKVRNDEEITPADLAPKRSRRVAATSAFFVMRLTEAGVFYRAAGPTSRVRAEEELRANGGFLLELDHYPAPEGRTDSDTLGMADRNQIIAQEEEKKRDAVHRRRML